MSSARIVPSLQQGTGDTDPCPAGDPPAYSTETILDGLRRLASPAATSEASSFAAEPDEVHDTPEDSWCVHVDLEHVLDELSEQQRRALQLCVGEGLTATEAGERLGISRQCLTRHLRSGMTRVLQSLGVWQAAAERRSRAPSRAGASA